MKTIIHKLTEEYLDSLKYFDDEFEVIRVKSAFIKGINTALTNHEILKFIIFEYHEWSYEMGHYDVNEQCSLEHWINRKLNN